MSRLTAAQAGGTNVLAFLDMLAWSELGDKLIAASDNGYNVIVGSTPGNLILFHDYSKHPGRYVNIKPGLTSSAAGRYQVLEKYAKHYIKQLGLPDFSPASQDRIALQLIRECKALDDIKAGRIEQAAHKCRSRWASLPGAGYGQHEQKMDDLIAQYLAAGGKLA